MQSLKCHFISLMFRPNHPACLHLPGGLPHRGAAGGGQAGRQDPLRLLAGAHLPEEDQVQVLFLTVDSIDSNW